MPVVASFASMSLSCEQSLTSTPLVVLDTNAVLDWLLFGDPGMAVLAEALTAGRVRWIATAAMRVEFDNVLRRGLGDAWSADAGRIDDHWLRWCHQAEAPSTPAPWRCSDPDDQKFLDLAMAVGVRWLVTRDKALLRLRRAAAQRGLSIVTPPQWRPE
jgi:predicted nucleic acid-binding protein